MEKFERITGFAAPMPRANIDTDMITPSYILKEVTKKGLSWGLFREFRFNKDGSEKPDFVLNQPPYRKAKLIVSLENFGCGSSREHAPWALNDFGIRSIIAISFADIFFNNCFKNGILPVTLTSDQIKRVLVDAEAKKQIAVDLTEQVVILEDGTRFEFEITPFRKRCLMLGLDDIGLTLEHAPAIAAFEARQRQQLPWLYDRAAFAKRA